MSLYKKLAEFRNQFICIDTVSGGNVLRSSGLLLELNHDYLTLRLYDEHTGDLDCEFSASVNTVVGVWAGHRDEKELSARVSWAAGEKALEESNNDKQ